MLITVHEIHDVIRRSPELCNQQFSKDVFIRAICIMIKHNYDMLSSLKNLDYLYAHYQLVYNNNTTPMHIFIEDKHLSRLP
jgi:hypothetical protein